MLEWLTLCNNVSRIHRSQIIRKSNFYFFASDLFLRPFESPEKSSFLLFDKLAEKHKFDLVAGVP
jgi:hypothetical protein